MVILIPTQLRLLDLVGRLMLRLVEDAENELEQYKGELQSVNPARDRAKTRDKRLN